ncbi:MAG: PQQ-like beta-propeller repeat protein [Acidobacteria bacterium]|nr:PQQ-like beta-propeller repeat protein [Acidobacteriota bacterium]
MFEPQEREPWYRSPVLKVGAVAVVALVGLAVFYQFVGYRLFRGDETHYSELERHREQQRQQAAGLPAQPDPNAPAVPAVDPNAAANANQQPGTAASPQPGQPAAAPGQPAPSGGEASHAAAPAPAGRNYWTNFRGPARDGNYAERAVKVNWPAGGLKPVWKQPVGGGFASFVVADGVAYTVEQRRRQEVATAYQLDTGRELWAHAWDAEYTDSTGDGPRSTPTWDEGRVYVLGALGELRCLDARTGKRVWNKNILQDNGAENLQWAMSASPLVVDDKVIVVPGGRAGKSVVAYNKLTGAALWKVQNDPAAYASPSLVTLAGRRQVLVVTGSRLLGLAPEDGALLWSHPWSVSYGVGASQPLVVGKNRVFITAGYGKGAALLEVTGGGKSFAARTVWENTSLKTQFNSPVIHNGHAYGLDGEILTCVDVETGDRKWKGGRYGRGQLLLASGHLIITTETGEIALVKADPAAFAEIARFPALEGQTWNVPAIANGRLLVRNATQMASFNIAE